MTIRKIVTLMAGAAVTVALAASASAQEVTLKAGSFLPLTINFGEPFKKFVDHVNAENKGRDPDPRCRRARGGAAVPAR